MQNVLVTRRYLVTGAKRVSNYWWAFIVSSGGLAFFLTGFASFLQKGIFVFNQSKTISFFPQGLIMCFYGCLGLLFGFYLWCTILWEVGDGFNEFNKNQGFVRIFRWGLPGKNRRIDFKYKIDEIEGVRVELKEGVNPRRVIFLKIKEISQSETDSELMQKNEILKPDRNSSSNTIVERESLIKKSQISKVGSSSPKQTFNKVNNKSNNKPLLRSKGSISARGNKNQRTAFTVPLTRVGQPISLEKIENQASELAQFLRVSLETSYLDS